MNKQTVLNSIASFFKDNPEISYKSFEEDVYKIFLNVQKESIRPYTPLNVAPINKNINEFDVSEIHHETKSIFDEDVR